MLRPRFASSLFLFLAMLAPTAKAQLGKNVIVPAGSEADHQLTAIANATDPAEKLKLIDALAAAHPDGDLAIAADEQYVNYYLNAKQYDKAFEYGDKLFALDPDNFNNAVNLVRAANESGNTDRLFTYAQKANDIVQRYIAMSPPEGASAEAFQQQRTQRLDAIKESRDYIEQSLFSASFQQKDPAKKADYLMRFAKLYPDSPYTPQAISMAAVAYQQSQNTPKMLEVANAAIAKDPNNIGMLLLLADYYSEKGEQLDKAGEYATKAAALCDTAKKPDGYTDEQWKKQLTLQKGLALSALGQVNIEKKDNLNAVKNLTAAAPLLKADNMSYARNQYRLGFAYLNLKKAPEARQAFTDAASVDTPYKPMAQDKLKGMGPAKPAAKSAAKKPAA